MSDVFDVAPATWLVLDLLSPGLDGSSTKTCCYEIVEEDDNLKKCEVLRNIKLASCRN
jgi:hypothetical protein